MVLSTLFENFCSNRNAYNFQWFNRKIEELVQLAMAQDAAGIKSKLKEIVPDCTPFQMNK